MAELSQLKMLLDLEQQREDKTAKDFAEVQQQVQDNQMRLDGMSKYRLDYLNQLQQRGQGGIQSMQVSQYHAFVGKLDEGVEQLHHEVVKLQQVLAQRKERWLAQRRKRESIEHLIKEKEKRAQKVQARKEQKNLDDFSSQRFIRDKSLTQIAGTPLYFEQVSYSGHETMQQLLNLTESTENFVRTGGKAGGKALGKELSLGAGDSAEGEFSRLMMQQTEKGKEFQKVKLMPEQPTIKKDIDGEGRRNVGGPVESNLFELLQEMQQQMAEVSSEEGELSADEVAAVVSIDETQLEKTGDIELSDADLEELLAVFVDKLSHQQGEQKEFSAEQRQSLAESMLAQMTDEQKQQLMEQLNAIAKGGADAADQKFIVQLLEPMMPKSDADKLLVGKESNKQVSHALLAALRDVAPESKQESQKSSDPAQLMKQLEAQLAALKENGNTDAKALTGKERGKLEQLMAELRQLMGGASDNKESLTKEQATKAEQLIADLRQTLKQSSDKASAVELRLMRSLVKRNLR